MTNQETLGLCGKLGIGVKTQSSTIIEQQADRVRVRAKREGLVRDEQPAEPKPVKKAATKKAVSTSASGKVVAKKAPAKKTAAKRTAPKKPTSAKVSGDSVKKSAPAIVTSSPVPDAPIISSAQPIRSASPSAPRLERPTPAPATSAPKTVAVPVAAVPTSTAPTSGTPTPPAPVERPTQPRPGATSGRAIPPPPGGGRKIPPPPGSAVRRPPDGGGIRPPMNRTPGRPTGAPTLAQGEFRLPLLAVDRWELAAHFVHRAQARVGVRRVLLVRAPEERLAVLVLLDQVEGVHLVVLVGVHQVVRVVVVVRVVRVVVVPVDAALVSVVHHERNRVPVGVKILMRCCHRQSPPTPQALWQFRRELLSSSVDHRPRSLLLN